jgi:hypothetical protein
MVELAYNASELALAAYANLFPGRTADQLDVLTANNNMSAYQTQEFALRYPMIVAQINDTATSFSATVFADASGNLAVAIRGTLEAGDLVPTDVDIAVNGIGAGACILLPVSAAAAAGYPLGGPRTRGFA